MEDRRRWVVSGGIGSGKSQVRILLGDHGFTTLDADSVGHEVLASDGPAFAEVAERWPHTVKEGEIDRSALGEIVFSDPRQLQQLEEITHPHIFGTIRDRIQEISGPVAVEIPLLKHRLGREWARLIVDCRDETRIERLREKGVEDSDVRRRMSRQPTRGEWLSQADAVIPNHGTIEDLRRSVDLFVELV